MTHLHSCLGEEEEGEVYIAEGCENADLFIIHPLFLLY